MKKILSILLCAALLFCVTACSNGTSSSVIPTFNTPEPAGVLFVSIGAEFKIVYDTQGMTVAAEGINEAAYEAVSAQGNTSGIACSTVISKLVETAIAQGSNQLNRVVVIKQAPGGQVPSDTFLEEIRTATVGITDFEVVLVTADTLTSEGYISADTAKDILLRQLKLTNVTVRCSEVSEDLYTLTCEISGAEREYQLYATTGTVILNPNAEEEVVSPDGEMMDGDFFEEYDERPRQEQEQSTAQELEEAEGIQ